MLGSAATSASGDAIVFTDANWHEVYLANGRGVLHVAHGNRSAISNSGKYVLAINAPGAHGWPYEPREGDRLILYRASDGKTFSAHLPAVPKGYLNESNEQQWPETGELYIDDSPAVVFGIRSGPNPLRRLADGYQVLPTTQPVSSMVYLKWTPGNEWKLVTHPDESRQVALTPDDSALTMKNLPIVEFGPGGWNARRAVWDRPDGTTVELLRQNDVPVRITLCPRGVNGQPLILGMEHRFQKNWRGREGLGYEDANGGWRTRCRSGPPRERHRDFKMSG